MTFLVVRAYARLRLWATSKAPPYWDHLHSTGPITTAPTSISASRAYDMAAALLLHNFVLGDLIRWLGGDYTHDHINMAPIEAAVAAIRGHPRPPGFPVVDYDRALHVLRHGAPLSAAYTCKRADVLLRNLYDNHSGARNATAAVLKKIVDGCNNQFLLVFPRWLFRFIYGLFLSPIGFIERKGKGRVVVDPSAHIHSAADSGALNDTMSKDDKEQCPPTFYASAQLRHWTHIWNLRITHPSNDILLYKDDINAAFHRCRYHPDISAAYAYVWEQWLIIHIGLIFGGRNSPGWFCLVSELRAAIAMYYDGVHDCPLHPLVSRIVFPPPASPAAVATLSPAQADPLNPGTCPRLSDATSHATFVDDNLMAEISARMAPSINASTGSCYLLFGHPALPLRSPSLSEEKFEKAAAWLMEHLGLEINTRLMRIIFPASKRTALLEIIDRDWKVGAQMTISVSAVILGHLRTAAAIQPLGAYFSIRIQQWQNTCLALLRARLPPGASPTARSKSAWRCGRHFRVSSHIARDVSFVRQLLASRSADALWSRPIGLLIPRTPHMTSLTDASYEGLGGWCLSPPFKWRLSSSTLATRGWPVLTTEPPRYRPLPPGKWHINVLEFMAVFINTWLSIHLLSRQAMPPGGWILHLRADNTSALSWMHHSSRSQRPLVQDITRGYAAFITFFMPNTFAIMRSHIPGSLNDQADTLSRPWQYPTMRQVHSQCPDLAPLPGYHIPSPLLSHLLWLVSQPQTGEQLESATIALRSLEPVILSPGALPGAFPTPPSPSHPRRKRARSSQRTRRK